MLPAITDELIDDLVLNPRMIVAGRDYWNRGRVSQLALDVEASTVGAAVRGNELYMVKILFADRTGICSCPVGLACKHVAATLFALRDHLQKVRETDPLTYKWLTSGQRALLAPIPAVPPVTLPADVAKWLGQMLPIARAAQPETTVAAAPQAVYYTIRAHPIEGAPKAGGQKKGKQPPEDLAGRTRRLAVQAVNVPLDAEGKPRTVGSPVSLYALSYNPGAAPKHATPDDVLLLRRLASRIGEVDAEGCLENNGGIELLRRLIDTGRAHWHSPKGPGLSWGDPAEGRFTWTIDDQARTHIALQVEAAPAAMIAAIAPPLAVDPATGLIRPIDTGAAPLAAEQLLRLPPLTPDAVVALAAQWRDVAPAHIPPPAKPDIRDIGMIAPVPVLSLVIDKVTMIERHQRRYYGDKHVKAPWATARLSFDYGLAHAGAGTKEAVLLVRDGDTLAYLHRDLAAERDAQLRLDESRLFPLDDFEDVVVAGHQLWDRAPAMLAQPSDFVPFMVLDAVDLRAEGWRIEPSPKFPLRLADVDSASFTFSIEPSGIDWFDLALRVEIDGERIDLAPLLTQMLEGMNRKAMEQLVDADDAVLEDQVISLTMPDGRIAPIPLKAVVPMLRALLLLASREPHAPAPTGFASHDLGMLAAIDETRGSTNWHGAEQLRTLAAALTALRFDPTPLPPGFEATLRPYQETGLGWLQALDGAGFGGLLADDMGLGKTVQTLAHIAVLKAKGVLEHPALIVAPTSVLPNWQAEIARFLPGWNVLLLHGSERRAHMDAIATSDIVLTSYPLIVRDEKLLAARDFGLIVYDEAHVLKNPRTAGHGAARRLTARRRIALTGTPVENRLTDAWALFDLIVPGLLGSLAHFTREYRTPIEKHGDPNARMRLARKLKPFLLRRTKEKVAADLPEKSLIPELIDLGADQMALHESQRLLMHERIRAEIARVGLMRAQILVLSALTRLRQICCDPRLVAQEDAKSPASAKLERLLEMLDELIPEGRRIILFSQFTSMLDLIKPELDKRDIRWTELTGKTKDRTSPVARFQAGEVPLILVSLKAGGTGLNLTAADTVLLYDPWWNPAIEAQAIDRAHRIGQTKPVFVHRLIAKGTIEEKILTLQSRKSAIAGTLWSEDSAAPAQLSEEDIAFLLAS